MINTLIDKWFVEPSISIQEGIIHYYDELMVVLSFVIAFVGISIILFVISIILFVRLCINNQIRIRLSMLSGNCWSGNLYWILYGLAIDTFWTLIPGVILAFVTVALLVWLYLFNINIFFTLLFILLVFTYLLFELVLAFDLALCGLLFTLVEKILLHIILALLYVKYFIISLLLNTNTLFILLNILTIMYFGFPIVIIDSDNSIFSLISCLLMIVIGGKQKEGYTVIGNGTVDDIYEMSKSFHDKKKLIRASLSWHAHLVYTLHCPEFDLISSKFPSDIVRDLAQGYFRNPKVSRRYVYKTGPRAGILAPITYTNRSRLEAEFFSSLLCSGNVFIDLDYVDPVDTCNNHMDIVLRGVHFWFRSDDDNKYVGVINDISYGKLVKWFDDMSSKYSFGSDLHVALSRALKMCYVKYKMRNYAGNTVISKIDTYIINNTNVWSISSIPYHRNKILYAVGEFDKNNLQYAHEYYTKANKDFYRIWDLRRLLTKFTGYFKVDDIFYFHNDLRVKVMVNRNYNVNNSLDQVLQVMGERKALIFFRSRVLDYYKVIDSIAESADILHKISMKDISRRNNTNN